MKKLNLIPLREYKTPMSFVNLFCLAVNTENRLLNLREPENLNLANENLRLADGDEADLFTEDEDFYLTNLDVYNIPKTMDEAKQRILFGQDLSVPTFMLRNGHYNSDDMTCLEEVTGRNFSDSGYWRTNNPTPRLFMLLDDWESWFGKKICKPLTKRIELLDKDHLIDIQKIPTYYMKDLVEAIDVLPTALDVATQLVETGFLEGKEKLKNATIEMLLTVEIKPSDFIGVMKYADILDKLFSNNKSDVITGEYQVNRMIYSWIAGKKIEFPTHSVGVLLEFLASIHNRLGKENNFVSSLINTVFNESSFLEDLKFEFTSDRKWLEDNLPLEIEEFLVDYVELHLLALESGLTLRPIDFS
jgi:hypothetical protein